MVEKCCTHYLRVGFLLKPKNEIYVCPVCGKIYYGRMSAFKRWILSKICKSVNMYDDRQVRLYWVLDKPMVIADNTGEKIKKIEEGLAKIKEEMR